MTDLARKIAKERSSGKPVLESDAEELISHLLKYDSTREGGIVTVIADAIRNNISSGHQRISVSKSLAAHIDANNLKKKYSPKVRESELPIRYCGGEWYMKELTLKTKHPLHFVFLSENGQDYVQAFDDYASVESVLDREQIINAISLEVQKQNYELKPQGQKQQTPCNPPISECVGGWGVGSDNRPVYFPCLYQVTKPNPLDAKFPNAAYPILNGEFFEHVDYGGEKMELPIGRAWYDLTKETLHEFFWIETEDWNDDISSVKSGEGKIVVFEHINGGGATLTIPGTRPTPNFKEAISCFGKPYTYIASWNINRRAIPWLGALGWNDRISCIYHYR